MIYLDMDGVLTDFHKDAFKLFGHDAHEPDGMVHEVLGITKGQFWARIATAGEKFWSNMTLLPWAEELYAELCRADEVVILTSPGRLPAAASGKMKFLRGFLGRNQKNFIITKRKELLARDSGDILVDDSAPNIDAFNEAGGVGILMPAYWNRGKDKVGQEMETVMDQIQRLYPKYDAPEKYALFK